MKRPTESPRSDRRGDDAAIGTSRATWPPKSSDGEESVQFSVFIKVKCPRILVGNSFCSERAGGVSLRARKLTLPARLSKLFGTKSLLNTEHYYAWLFAFLPPAPARSPRCKDRTAGNR